ncbi:MAG: sigma-54-dependent transcriptional regulator [Planctomycetota bacterium]|jgi:DNA-binding NtrC family response regulator
MAKVKLTNDDREFFRLVSNVPAANPFSRQRADIDEEISGIHEAEDRRHRVLYAAEAIRKRLAQLDTNGALRYQDFDDRDCELMRYTYLFDVYQSCCDLFDDFIPKQEKTGSTSLKVPFAAKAIDTLRKRGFGEKTIVQDFAFFYQIRRAFYFIDRGLVGKSDSMRQLRMALWNNIFTCDAFGYERYMWDKMEDFSTLLTGPTGSGKGAAAAAIGKSGFIPYDPDKQQFKTSFTRSFIPVNLSQFAESLLESELFGHTKGAFTGAVGEHQGVLGLCRPHGSIFLDEIGEVSIPVQVKLLKVLEDRTFTPVGSHQPQRFGGRVIAATNQPIEQLRDEGVFRDDFYYRLCSDCIHVPSLAERVRENPDELAELVEHFCGVIVGQKDTELIGRVLDVVDKKLGGTAYAWPGNVRELAQCIRRVILKRDYEGQVPQNSEKQSSLADHIHAGTLTADELLDRYCKMLYDRHGTYEQVAKLTALDRRTVKKRIGN